MLPATPLSREELLVEASARGEPVFASLTEEDIQRDVTTAQRWLAKHRRIPLPAPTARLPLARRIPSR
jgi:hypothetical protein